MRRTKVKAGCDVLLMGRGGGGSNRGLGLTTGQHHDHDINLSVLPLITVGQSEPEETRVRTEQIPNGFTRTQGWTARGA